MVVVVVFVVVYVGCIVAVVAYQAQKIIIIESGAGRTLPRIIGTIWLGWVSCVFPIIAISTHETIICCRKKASPMPLLTEFFLGWVGLGSGSSSVSSKYFYVFQPSIIW